MLKTAIILGSTRPGRNGEAVAHWVLDLAQQRTDATFELVDLADHHLPAIDEPVPPARGVYTHEHTKTWARTIARYQGYVLVTPEYNHSAPGALKNAQPCLPMKCVTFDVPGPDGMETLRNDSQAATPKLFARRSSGRVRERIPPLGVAARLFGVELGQQRVQPVDLLRRHRHRSRRGRLRLDRTHRMRRPDSQPPVRRAAVDRMTVRFGDRAGQLVVEDAAGHEDFDRRGELVTVVAVDGHGRVAGRAAP